VERRQSGALEREIDVIYPELPRIAIKHLARRRPGESLESAALANEAYLKLLHRGGIRCENRIHFLALCSQMIRRILIDHVRSHAVSSNAEVVEVRVAGGDFRREKLRWFCAGTPAETSVTSQKEGTVIPCSIRSESYPVGCSRS